MTVTVTKPPPSSLVHLIDDQALVAAAVRRHFASRPELVVEHTSDPELAAAESARLRPDVILLDLVMPKMDGFAVLGALRAQVETMETPIVVLSTTEDPAVKARAFEQGANDYVIKLPDATELIARVRYHAATGRAKCECEDALARLRLSERALSEANRQLELLATTDGLTGLYNRRHFDKRVPEEWSRGCRTGQPLSLLFVDIDHFKTFNDHYGHPAGDAALSAVATALSASATRAGDVCARYGGEEFVALLTSTGPPGALVVAERFLAKVAALQIAHAASTTRATLSASVGIATVVPNVDSESKALIDAADAALYAAKRAGRNRVHVGDLPGAS